MAPSESPLVGVDVDGILSDLVGPLLDAVHASCGRRFLRQDVVRFDLAGILGPRCWDAAREILSAPGYALSLPVLPNAVDGIEALRSICRVVFVTTPFAPSPTWAYDRALWLEQKFSAQPADIASLADKTLFRGRILVDDSPMHLKEWTKTGRVAVRMVQPWNQGAPGVPASCWDDVVRIVRDQLAEEN